MATMSCFHCGEPVPKRLDLKVTIDTLQQIMCCIGCQAVAQTIVDNNLTQYYRFRTEPANKGSSLVPEQLKRHQLLDDENLQGEFIYQQGEHKQAILSVDGISCAACAWLIETQLAKLTGLGSIKVNATTQRAIVVWQESQLNLSDILLAIDKIGYQAMPFKASSVEQKNKKQSKAFIKRLGISGILMMQILMIAFGLYFGAFSDMAAHNLVYLRWVSFILTLPIVFYAALPFYSGAYSALRIRRLTMDVPVSIAIILAFSASAWATISQQGEVYFESVAMFSFLLLVGKFLEFRVRARAAEISANLLKLMPMTAIRLVDDKEQQEQQVLAKTLNAGDIVIIKPGEVIPADGTIISGQSQINEAMLSGEQLPVEKTVGAVVLAGTINGDGNLKITVKGASQDSFLNQLIRLSETSGAHKPKLAQLSDKIAQYFIAIILFSAIASAIYWQQHLPGEAFWIAVSVLVATCPCALSLATPTALTCATSRLNHEGIMIKSAHVMETFPKINCYAFDKTGTLTTGVFSIDKTVLHAHKTIWADEQQQTTQQNTQQTQSALAIAAAMELHSEHPLAKPFAKYRDAAVNATKVKVYGGAGITAKVERKSYSIGKPSWLLSGDLLAQYQDSQCVLMQENTLVAVFYLSDNIRPDAQQLITSLNTQNNKTLLLSGDSAEGCQKILSALPISEVFSALSAQDKMRIIKQQPQRSVVAMVGDGVNDSPVFGAAHVSIAMGSGTDVAKNGADVILLNNKLSSIKTLSAVALKTRRIVFQNYLWAFAYNAVVLPLAMAGYITPYIAVIGMSASSILVITNSLRLLKK